MQSHCRSSFSKKPSSRHCDRSRANVTINAEAAKDAKKNSISSRPSRPLRSTAASPSRTRSSLRLACSLRLFSDPDISHERQMIRGDQRESCTRQLDTDDFDSSRVVDVVEMENLKQPRVGPPVF